MQQRTTKQFTISLPPDMAEQVIAAAKTESRTISELFREAFRSYRAQRVRALLENAQAEGLLRAHIGHKPEDVAQLVDEVRADRGRV